MEKLLMKAFKRGIKWADENKNIYDVTDYEMKELLKDLLLKINSQEAQISNSQ